MQDASSKEQTKQKYKPNHQQTGLPPHSALTSEEKQTNKNSAQISPYKKLTQTTGPTLWGQKPKGRKNSDLKPGKRRPQTQYVKKKIIMKRQRNTTQMKEQTRNTEVQINDKEIGQITWKRIQNNDSKDDRNLEKCRKCKNQLTKT